MLRNRGMNYNWLSTMLLTKIRPVISLRRYSSIKHENIKGSYDIIIAGGGMVGCTLACAMGKYTLISI